MVTHGNAGHGCTVTIVAIVAMVSIDTMRMRIRRPCNVTCNATLWSV